MATTAEIILDTRRESKNGYPIKIRITNRGRKYIPLNAYSSADDWANGNVLKSHPDYRKLFFALNKRSLQLIEEVELCVAHDFDLDQSYEIIKNGILDKNTEALILKERLKQIEQKAKVGLVEFFDVRIAEKLKSNESVTAYSEIREQLFTYLGESDINMNDVTYEWLNGYVLHKLSDKCSRAGVNAYLASIRAVYKEAQRRKSLQVKADNPFTGLIKKASPVRDIAELTKDDFTKLREFTGTQGQSEARNTITKRNIDIWLLQFLVGGHYYVDLALMKWTDIKNDRWKFKRYKNRNKADGGVQVNVRLFPEALEIIKRYGDKSTERVFGFIPDATENELKYKQFMRNINRSLESVSKNLKLTSHITSRSCRYVFGSAAASLFISDFTIEEIQGHQHKNTSFRYRKLPLDVQDQSHRQVIDSLW